MVNRMITSGDTLKIKKSPPQNSQVKYLSKYIKEGLTNVEYPETLKRLYKVTVEAQDYQRRSPFLRKKLGAQVQNDYV